MNNTIPHDVSSIMKILENNKYEIWLVGGCVRDMLMNKSCNDYDLAREFAALAGRELKPLDLDDLKAYDGLKKD